MGSSNGGRFTSKYDERGLVAAVHEVAVHCRPADPEAVSTRAFDAGRAAAGHPDLPTAKQIAARLKRPWARVLHLAGKTGLSVAQALAPRAPLAQDWMTEEIGVVALRTVASRLQVETLRPDQYARDRDAIVAADRRRHKHGQDLRLPTEGQIERIFGSWDAGLERAGLRPRVRKDRAAGVSYPDAIERCIEKYGTLPSSKDLERFARGEGFPLAKKTEPYPQTIAAVRASRDQRGLVTPETWPPSADRPDYEHPAQQTAAKPDEQRSQRRWTDEQIVEAMILFLDWLDDHQGAKATQANYTRFGEGRPDIPGPTVVVRHGGHGHFLAEASRIRRERRIA